MHFPRFILLLSLLVALLTSCGGGSGSSTTTTIDDGDDSTVGFTAESGGSILTLGTTGSDIINDVETDGDGNIYVCGETEGDFEGGTNAGGLDGFVAKYDAGGTLIWSEQFGYPYSDSAFALTLDENGNLYVAGYSDQGSGNRDGFLRKYVIDTLNPGMLKEEWTRMIDGGAYTVTVSDIALYRPSGDPNIPPLYIYVVGNTWADLDTTFTMSGEGALPDAFVSKYSAGGILQTGWPRQIGSAASDYGSGVAVDSTGDVYVVGTTNGSVITGATGSMESLFLYKYEGDGTKVISKQIGYSSDLSALDVVVDESGVVDALPVAYVAVTLDMSLGGYGSDAAIYEMVHYQNIDTSWNFIPSIFGQVQSDLNDQGVRLALDGAGYLYAMCNYDIGTGGGYDIHLAKYDLAADGALVWKKLLGSDVADMGTSLYYDPAGYLYLGGVTLGDINGTNAGAADGFVAKYDTDGVLQ